MTSIISNNRTVNIYAHNHTVYTHEYIYKSPGNTIIEKYIKTLKLLYLMFVHINYNYAYSKE